MAEPSQAPSSQGPPQENTAPTVNLQVLSPSVGVNRPLSFAGIPASTTIHQLKERIRGTLASRPADDQQRLIHRGRLLARDSETLQDVFGLETLRSGDQQTLHLVLRDIPEHHASSQQPTPLRGQSPAPGTIPTRTSESQLPLHAQNAHARLGRATPVQGFQNAQVPVADMGRPTLASQMQMMQRQHEATVHQTTVQWMNQLQREAGYRQLLNQQQRERAAMGMHGAQESNPQGPTQGDNPSGRNSPAIGQPVHNVTREVIGPNGQYWRMTVGETVVRPRTNSPQPHPLQAGRGPLVPAEVHNIIRNADANQATRAMTNAMHRSASGASLANMANINAPIQPIAPGVTTPLIPDGSRTATPDPSMRTPSHGSSSAPPASQNIPQAQPQQGSPEVYILSSPTGPRALLVNSSSDVYFTPALRSLVPRSIRSNITLRQPLHQTYPWTPQIHTPQNQVPPQGQQGQVQLQQPLPQGRNETQPLAPEAQIARGAVPAQPHPHNPAGAGALMAMAWPHIWLLIRLAAFVWWFTASDTSWSRWFAVVSMAIAVFVVNTGLLNGVAHQVWDPFRRHLEGLIPFADPVREHPADNNNNNRPAPAAEPTAARHQGPVPEPDPVAAAARLVANRRNANANWFLDRVRRLERAGLLFLASIAPGVAERHIAHLEAQERAERQRREAEETAAREAAEREAAEREAESARDAEAENAGTTGDDAWAEHVGEGAREPLVAQ